jgi:DNA gyrase subunit A
MSEILPEPILHEESNERLILNPIQEEMKKAYVNYAMSVIVGRALPDVKDGLKPVHRRILYAMYDLGMFHNKPFKKCARIVGEVLGKYHPHGDTAVYDSLVRMAQDFSLGYPLIKGQGNFGSIDGDNAAAMRYTEAKLAKLAGEILKDIEKDTVDFKDNFDSSLKEPIVLPSKIPNLLINGSSGIAVGMATNIPPHNLSEVCEAIVETINNPEITIIELMAIVPGPDFPTGGEVYVGEELLSGYTRGRGRVIIKSVVEIDEEKNKLIVKEIPYQVNKTDLILQIAELVKDKRVLGIRNINDESDREGIRVVVDLKKDADSNVVLNQLYKYSRLQISFSLNMLALVNNQPKTLSLKDFIDQHILHRKDVIVRRTNYDLKKAEERLHILDGLLTAINNLDEIIPGIRGSATVDEAKQFLINNYSLTEIQAKAILEMKLQKLASLEQDKIRIEHNDLETLAQSLRDILDSEDKIREIIIDETNEIKDKYGHDRFSKILIGESRDIDMEDLIEESTQVVTLTNAGYLKRLNLDTYRTQNRGGVGVTATGMRDEDFVEKVYVASTHSYLLCITDRGQLYWLKVYRIPEGSRQAKGKHMANLLELKKGENISAIIPVKDFGEGYLFLATSYGTVKKTAISLFSKPRRGGIRAIELDDGDSLIAGRYTHGNQEIILATKKGHANRFNETEVRAMGRTARGVRGIRLNAGDEVVGLLVAQMGKQILTITKKGYGKRTAIEEYRLCHRGGKGVTNVKITPKNGEVVTTRLVDGSGELMLISRNGIAIRLPCESVSQIGRATQGVRIMRLREGDTVAAAARIMTGQVEDDIEEEEDLGEKNVSDQPLVPAVIEPNETAVVKVQNESSELVELPEDEDSKTNLDEDTSDDVSSEQNE